MEPKLRKKIRGTVKSIRKDMEDDAKLRRAVQKNHIRVLHERGKLKLHEIIAAHDMKWCKSGSSTSGPCADALSLGQ